MNTEYYRLRRYADNPKANGIVVKIEEGKLEMFAGSHDPSEFGLSLSKGKLKYDSTKYFETQIAEKEANGLREDWEMQLWAGTDPISIAIKSEAAYKSLT